MRNALSGGLRWLAFTWVVGLLWATSGASVAWAQSQETADAAPVAAEAEDDRATAFRAVRGAPREQVAGGPLLLGAYALLWLLTCLYLWRLGRMQRQLALEVQALQRQRRSEQPPRS